MAIFTMMVGIPGSGKTAYANEVMKTDNTVVVSSDEVRKFLYDDETVQFDNKLVFDIAHRKVIANLKAGKDVIFDATNLKFKNRMNFLNWIDKEVDGVYKECVVVLRPICRCIKEDKACEKTVGEEVIQKMVESFQIPFKEEGWDEIRFVNPDCDYHIYFSNKRLSELFKMVLSSDFDQHSKYHNLALGVHCATVTNLVLYKAKDESLVYAAAVHDYGKLLKHTEDDDGNWHYYNHANRGAYQFLINLMKLPKGYIDWPSADIIPAEKVLDIAFYINYHMLCFDMNDKTKSKYARIFGEEKFNNLQLLHAADMYGKGGNNDDIV